MRLSPYPLHADGHPQRGFTLVELMIAVTIGLLILAMLTVVFVNVSNTNREQFKAAQQIENGRFAIDLLQNDIRLAGYYGEFPAIPEAMAALPDPCAIPAEGSITTASTTSPLAFFVQGYAAADLTSLPTVPAACAAWVDSTSLSPGSDILIVRRLDTTTLMKPSVAVPNPTAALVSGEVYAQTTRDALDVQYGANATINKTKNAKNVVSTLLQKDYSQATAGTPPIRPTMAAYIRKLHVHVYFVSKCRTGSGSNGKCTSTDDTIPTLKRLELGAQTMNLIPLVEGVEFLKIRYGLDKTSIIAGSTTDGTVDSVVTTPATVADWQNVVLVEARVLARNSDNTPLYTDSKSYDLKGDPDDLFTPSGSSVTYKRHLFTTQTYIMNIGGRREL